MAPRHPLPADGPQRSGAPLDRPARGGVGLHGSLGERHEHRRGRRSRSILEERQRAPRRQRRRQVRVEQLEQRELGLREATVGPDHPEEQIVAEGAVQLREGNLLQPQREEPVGELGSWAAAQSRAATRTRSLAACGAAAGSTDPGRAGACGRASTARGFREDAPAAVVEVLSQREPVAPIVSRSRAKAPRRPRPRRGHGEGAAGRPSLSPARALPIDPEIRRSSPPHGGCRATGPALFGGEDGEHGDEEIESARSGGDRSRHVLRAGGGRRVQQQELWWRRRNGRQRHTGARWLDRLHHVGRAGGDGLPAATDAPVEGGATVDAPTDSPASADGGLPDGYVGYVGNIPVSDQVTALGVNVTTDTVYAALADLNGRSAGIAVIDDATGALTHDCAAHVDGGPVPPYFDQPLMAVDSTSNVVYGVRQFGHVIDVFDGATNAYTGSIDVDALDTAAGPQLNWLAVDGTRSMLYALSGKNSTW